MDTPRDPLRPGWRRHEDLWNGFSVALPEGWGAFVDRDRFLATNARDGSLAAMLWPVSFAHPTNIEDAVSHVVRSLANGEPGFEAWVRPSDSDSARRVVFRRRSVRGEALRGELSVTLHGGRAALVRGYQCPETALAEGGPLAQAVAEGFALRESIPRERFVEPRERAFSYDYPRGWDATGSVDRGRTAQGGGVVVWSVEDPRSHARVQQQGVMIPMTVPTGAFMGAWGGLQRAYCDAPTFCREVLLGLARQAHPDLTLERVDPSPEVEAFAKRALAPVERKLGAPATVSGCLAWTRYTEGGLTFRECAVVTTWIIPQPPNPMSWMTGVAPSQSWFGTVGPTFRAPEAVFEAHLPILRGIADSHRANDAWEAHEVDQIAIKMAHEAAAAERQRVETLRATQDYIHRTEREIAERHAATNAEIARIGYNTVMGKEDVLDADHQSYKVDTGYDSYWAKDDRILGSNSTDLDAHLESDGWRRMRVF